MAYELDPHMMIVVAGPHSGITWEIAQKLKIVGFRDVIQENSIQKLLQHLSDAPPDLLILDGSNDSEVCARISEDIRLDRGICNFPIVVVMKSTGFMRVQKWLALFDITRYASHPVIPGNLMETLTHTVSHFDTSRVEAALARAKAALRQTNSKGAIESFREARQTGETVRTEVGLTQAYLLENDLDAAEGFAQRARQIHPSCFATLVCDLELILVRNNSDDVVLQWADAVPLAALESHRIPLFLKTFSRCQRQAVGIAIAQKLEPDWEQRNPTGFHLSLAHLYFEMGAEEQALLLLLQVQRQGEARLEALNLMGVIYNHRGDSALAVSYYEEALKESPGDYRILFNIGLALERLGKHREALDRYQAVTELAPGFVRAREHLEDLWRRIDAKPG